MEAPHAAVHRLGREIAELAAAGASTTPRPNSRELDTQASEQIFAHIDALLVEAGEIDTCTAPPGSRARRCSPAFCAADTGRPTAPAAGAHRAGSARVPASNRRAVTAATPRGGRRRPTRVLRLARCAAAADRGTRAPAAVPVGRTTVGGALPGPELRGRCIVPAHVQVLADVLVAARPLARGVPLTADDLARQTARI
ncbi:MAG: hypothetical protein MZV65_52225 [Chromatiales bacterium]|nr:hypothetical protein [Chromatiales bacterium]